MTDDDRKVQTTIEMDDGYLIVTDKHPMDFEFIDSEGWMQYFVIVTDIQGRELYLNPNGITRMVTKYE